MVALTATLACGPTSDGQGTPVVSSNCGTPSTTDIQVGHVGYDLSIGTIDNGRTFTIPAGRSILVLFRCGEVGNPGYPPTPLNIDKSLPPGAEVLAMTLRGTDKGGNSFGLFQAMRAGIAALEVAVSNIGCSGDNCNATHVVWSVQIHVIAAT
jgi:hypothetical protein